MGQVSRTWSFSGPNNLLRPDGISIYGIMLNFAAVAVQLAALDIAHVAASQTGFGIAGIVGRIASGWLLDRFPGYLVALVTTLLSFVSLSLFAISNSFALFAIAATLLGVCSGSESNFMPFFAGKQFGLRSVSKVLGWFMFAFFAGAMAGPAVFAEAGGALRSYAPVLWALAAIQVVVIWLYWSMRAFNEYDHGAEVSKERRDVRIEMSQADSL